MKRILTALLALSLIPWICCKEESSPARSREQAEFERKLAAEIEDHAVQIARLKVPPEARTTRAEALDALAIARLRLKDLEEAQPKRWQSAQVFAVIAVEKLRKAHDDARAAAEGAGTASPAK